MNTDIDVKSILRRIFRHCTRFKLLLRLPSEIEFRSKQLYLMHIIYLRCTEYYLLALYSHLPHYGFEISTNISLIDWQK